MRTFHRIGWLGGALLGGVLLCVGCLNQVSGSEKLNQGSLADKPMDPGSPDCKPPPPPPPDPGCTKGELGDGMTCHDGATLKVQALDICMQAGLALTDLNVVSSPGCAAGEWTKADYSCCKPAPPPPPDPGCTKGELGDGMTCHDGATLKVQALDICMQAGLALTDLNVVSSPGCAAGEWTKADYSCCKQSPPPPDPGCTKGELGDGMTCHDGATLKTQVLDICMQAGLALTDLKVGSSPGCAAGEWTKADYACCKQSPPPKP